MTGEKITPGERRELRSIVRGQFKVLRAEVKRREAEMTLEVETELALRYREQEADVQAAREEAAKVLGAARREVAVLGRALQEKYPDLAVGVERHSSSGLSTTNSNRAQVHRALMAAIPVRVGDAMLQLDRDEIRLLRALSEGVLESSEARGFLGQIPTVGELVPTARVRELLGETS